MSIIVNFNSLESINKNIQKLILVRRDNVLSKTDFEIVNGLLSALYNAKYDLLKKLYN